MNEDDFMWDLDSGLVEVRNLEPWFAARGWHCALAGSVLYSGRSDKDLDVIVFPHDTREGRFSSRIWDEMVSSFSPEKSGIAGEKRSPNARDGKDVRWWKKNGRRIDFFFLS